MFQTKHFLYIFYLLAQQRLTRLMQAILRIMNWNVNSLCIFYQYYECVDIVLYESFYGTAHYVICNFEYNQFFAC